MPNMKSLMVSVSGVRGVVGEGLTPDVVSRFAAAFGSFCGSGTVVVGRDTRISGEMMEYAVFSGLMAAGCTIIHLGISTTPTIQLAVERLNAAGGIAITASHNPIEWNALKFLDERGRFLNESDGKFLYDTVENNTYTCAGYNNPGKVSQVMNFENEHIKAILNAGYIKPEIIRQKNFKVVVDCVNGAGSRILPDLLEELGCDVVKLHCEPDGAFPRGPEPVPENITELCLAVKDSRANLGLACDPDADRLGVVDETGTPVGEEYSLVMAAMTVLSQQPGSIATNVSTTMAVDSIAEKYGVEVFRSPVGESHVVQKMIEHNCVIGGEGNGGIILPGVHYGRDAMVGAVLILQLIAQKKRKLSLILTELPKYYITKLKASIDKWRVVSLFAQIQKSATGARVDSTDGLKLIFPTYWVHLRLSSTEPIIRVIAEASTKKKADEIAERYLRQVTSLA